METNYQHYKKEIDEIILKGDVIAVVQNKPVGCQDDCEGCDDCLLGANKVEGCKEFRKRWLNAEYKEPEIEIDWFSVPIDTPVLVRDEEDQDWKKYHFALFNNLAEINHKGSFFTFPSGMTSWSNTSCDCMPWKYAKLARQEDIEKYRKDRR